MGIFSEGWREKDEMTARANSTGQDGTDPKREGESVTGNVGTPNNSAITPVPVQKEDHGEVVNPVVQQAAPPAVDPVLAAAQKQVADYDRQIQKLGYQFEGTDPDNMVRYLDTDAGKQAHQQLVADREKALNTLQDIERQQTDTHQYLADWGKDNFYNIISQGEGKNIPLAQAIGDYNLWASKHNGSPLDMYQIYPLLQNKDISKSLEQNVDDEKTRKRKERWQQIGNVLSHMANLYGTIHHAPSQQLEDGRQLTERQQRLWDAERQQRNRDVNSFLNLWLQHQRDKARERVNEANINLTNTRNNYYQGKAGNEAAESAKKQSRLDAEARSKNAYAAFMEQKGETEKVLRPEKVNTQKSAQNANNARAAASYSTANKNNRSGGGGKDDDYIAMANYYLEGNGGQEAQETARRILNENNTRTGTKGTKQMNKNVAKDVVKGVEANKQYSGKKKNYKTRLNTSSTLLPARNDLIKTTN